MTDQIMLDRRLDIVNDAMTQLLQKRILLKTPNPNDPPPACEDQTECLVNKVWDSDKVAQRMFQLALKFKTSDDYAAAIAKRSEEYKRREESDEGREAISDLLTSSAQDDFEDATRDLMRPFILIDEEDTLSRLACAHAVLNGEDHLLTNYYDTFKEDSTIRQGTSIGDYILEAQDIMRDLGTYDEWASLSDLDRSTLPCADGVLATSDKMESSGGLHDEHSAPSA